MTVDVHRLPDPATLFAAAADVFTRAAIDAVQRRGVFSVALAGGSTPRGLYSLLATDGQWRHTVPWGRVEFFWGDERHVPPDRAENNFRMAYDAMLSHVPVHPERVHRVISEHHDPAVAASWYEVDVRGLTQSRIGIPRLDLVILGIGADGHVASLFPGTQALTEQTRLVVSNWVDRLGAYRITMTLPLINAARQVMFIATGEEKAAAVRRALRPAEEALDVMPAQLVQPVQGRVVWLLDLASAGDTPIPGVASLEECHP